MIQKASSPITSRRTILHFLMAFVMMVMTRPDTVHAEDPFVIRGYYTTLMRMPTSGLP